MNREPPRKRRKKRASVPPALQCIYDLLRKSIECHSVCNGVVEEAAKLCNDQDSGKLFFEMICDYFCSSWLGSAAVLMVRILDKLLLHSNEVAQFVSEFLCRPHKSSKRRHGYIGIIKSLRLCHIEFGNSRGRNESSTHSQDLAALAVKVVWLVEKVADRTLTPSQKSRNVARLPTLCTSCASSYR